MSRKTHYQTEDSNHDGEGNFQPIACGRNDAWRISTNWYSVTCRRCRAARMVRELSLLDRRAQTKKTSDDHYLRLRPMRRIVWGGGRVKNTDKMRLDFLSANPRAVVYRRGVQHPPVEYLARAEERWRWTLHNNLRHAIDAAKGKR